MLVRVAALFAAAAAAATRSIFTLAATRPTGRTAIFAIQHLAGEEQNDTQSTQISRYTKPLLQPEKLHCFAAARSLFRVYEKQRVKEG